MLPIIDADGHLDEQPDEIIQYLDEPLRGQTIIPRGHGLFPSWQATENRTRVFLSSGRRHSPYRLDPTPEKWLEFADRAGIEQAVIYPTDALTFGMCEDAEVATYFARAYNTWVHERYTKFNPRLQCVALLPLQKIDAAVQELRRVRSELGMVAAMLPATQLRVPLGDPSLWPVYAEAEKLGCFLGVHGGHLWRGRDLMAGLKGAKVIIHHPVGQMVEMVSMMFEGVFETFPKLKVGFLEAGCGWVPYLMDRMDEKWAPGRGPLKKKPSDYIRDCPLYFSAEPYEHTLGLAIEMIGADHLFLASDFPHETDDEGFIQHLEEWRNLTGLTEADHRQILSETARQAYALPSIAVPAG